MASSSIILARTVSAIEDKRLVLQKASFARPLDFGTSWNSIRIGLRYCMTDSGANITGTPRFAIGVCSGTTNILGDASPTNWVGGITNAGTWTRFAGPNPTYYYPGGGGANFYPAESHGGALTIGGTQLGTFLIGAQPADGYRNMLFVQITKGSPNYTLGMFYNSTSVVDVSSEQFYTTIEASVPAFSGYSNATPRTIAASEGPGAFNALNIWWNQDVANMEFCDIAVVRIT